MEKVVYLLGAGFSAPLGLPVMGNFLDVAHEVHDSDPERYAAFNKVFAAFEGLGDVKTYYDGNMRNIEEVLSILAMEEEVGRGVAGQTERFASFIEEVIAARTDAIPMPTAGYGKAGGMPVIEQDALQKLFQVDLLSRYAHFFANIMNMRFALHGEPPTRSLLCVRDIEPKREYSVVTLNYDLVLEKCLKYIARNAVMDRDEVSAAQLHIRRLHGKVGWKIIPPTWRKDVDDELRKEWQGAYDDLCDASQLRILGYSLPDSDHYIRYLLKAAARRSTRLKSIDIICLDTGGDVRKRYENFVDFADKRFVGGLVQEYVNVPPGSIPSLLPSEDSGGQHVAVMDYLERKHTSFMASEGLSGP